jgi:hypothetical protein
MYIYSIPNPTQLQMDCGIDDQKADCLVPRTAPSLGVNGQASDECEMSECKKLAISKYDELSKHAQDELKNLATTEKIAQESAALLLVRTLCSGHHYIKLRQKLKLGYKCVDCNEPDPRKNNWGDGKYLCWLCVVCVIKQYQKKFPSVRLALKARRDQQAKLEEKNGVRVPKNLPLRFAKGPTTICVDCKRLSETEHFNGLCVECLYIKCVTTRTSMGCFFYTPCVACNTSYASVNHTPRVCAYCMDGWRQKFDDIKGDRMNERTPYD